MATPRKTIRVEEVLNFVNEQLRNDHWTPEEKRGIYVVLDKILHKTNQYAGFSYVDSYNPDDPEFEIGGKKEVSRNYNMKSRYIVQLETLTMTDPSTYIPIMILDYANVYRGANCSDALVDVSLSVRQILADSMSWWDKNNPTDVWNIMNHEEDNCYKVFDL